MLRSLVFLLLVGTSVSYSQIRSGAIVGTVLDPSGSPIPEANVDVVAEETNFSYTAKTNVASDYT